MRTFNRILVIAALATSVAATTISFADTAPVAAANATPSTTTATPAPTPTPAAADTTAVLTTDQRVTRLEQQLSALKDQNNQIVGQLAELSRDIDLLNKQQRSFYQDLNQRVQHLSSLVNTTGSGDTAEIPNVLAPKAKTPSANGADLQAKEESTYQAAFDSLIQKNFDQAKTQFQTYLTDYPNGEYVADTHYWLGEINAQQEDAPQAIKEYQIVVQQYPDSVKAADAELKLGNLQLKTGHQAEAIAAYQAVIQQHPTSTAAQLATAQLQQLNTAVVAS